MIENVTALLSGLIASVIASFIAWQAKKRAEERHSRLVNEIEKQKVEISAAFGPIKVTRVLEGDSTQPVGTSSELVERIKDQVLARISAAPGLSKDEIREEVHKQSSELQSRIAKIEERFPEESKLEKIASINDALLSERIDQLSQQVGNLEKRLLSKWDVALTVSTIIAGIAFVVGATYAVIKFLGKAP